MTCAVSAYANNPISGDSLTVTGPTSLEGDVQISDVTPVVADQWYLTLENGLFLFGDPSNDHTLSFDFNTGDQVMFWYPEKAAFRAGEIGSDSWDEANVGLYSAAFGYGSEASGSSSFAVGQYVSATEYASMAWGYSASASGVGSTAWGYGHASGDDSVAFGFWAEASGYYAIALGPLNFASGDNSVAFGTSNYARSYLSTVFGMHNIGSVDSANSGETTWLELDPLLEIGNGSYSNKSNAITVLKNGQTTLTNKAWQDELNGSDPLGTPVDATNSSDGEALVVEGHARFRGKLELEQAQGDISMGAFGTN